MYKLQQNIKS